MSTTSSGALSAGAQLVKNSPVSWLGPRLAGLFISWFFLGVLLMQSSHYFRYYSYDAGWLKVLVIVVVILSIAKTSIESQIIWDKGIIHYGDYENAARMSFLDAAETLGSNILTVAATSFFIYRVWLLTNKNWFLLIFLGLMEVGVIVLSALLLTSLYGKPPSSPNARTYGYPVSAIMITVDILITGITTWKLLRSRKGFNHKTDDLIDRLLRLCWESALPPTISALLTLVVYERYHATSLVSEAFNIITPRLYVFALMHTLTVRGKLRMVTGTSESTERPGASDEDGRPARIGLSVIKSNRLTQHVVAGSTPTHSELPIKIRVDTTSHISPADDFVRPTKPKRNVQTRPDSPPDDWSLSSLEQTEPEKKSTDLESSGTR